MDDTKEVWWCTTHDNGRVEDKPWWDEWSPYICMIKAEFPVDGDCVPVKGTFVPDKETADD